jgi:hypothetical protein
LIAVGEGISQDSYEAGNTADLVHAGNRALELAITTPFDAIVPFPVTMTFAFSNFRVGGALTRSS